MSLPGKRATVVSCYYPLPSSKHSIQDYIQWIYHFVTFVDSPLVIFSEGPAADVLQQMRDKANLSTSFLIIRKPFNTLKFSNDTWNTIWNSQLELSRAGPNPEWRDLHNIELYKIWANKCFFVEEVMSINPFNTEVFFWCDAGCWRDPLTAQICGPGWPDTSKIIPKKIHLLSMNQEDIFFKKLVPGLTHEEIVTKIPTEFIVTICGAMIAGDREAWTTFIPLYEKTLHLFIDNMKFGGDDQSVLTSTALWLHISNPTCAPIFYKAPDTPQFFQFEHLHMGDNWFAFQPHFSRHDFKLPLADSQHSA